MTNVPASPERASVRSERPPSTARSTSPEPPLTRPRTEHARQSRAERQPARTTRSQRAGSDHSAPDANRRARSGRQTRPRGAPTRARARPPHAPRRARRRVRGRARPSAESSNPTQSRRARAPTRQGRAPSEDPSRHKAHENPSCERRTRNPSGARSEDARPRLPAAQRVGQRRESDFKEPPGRLLRDAPEVEGGEGPTCRRGMRPADSPAAGLSVPARGKLGSGFRQLGAAILERPESRRCGLRGARSRSAGRAFGRATVTWAARARRGPSCVLRWPASRAIVAQSSVACSVPGHYKKDTTEHLFVKTADPTLLQVWAPQRPENACSAGFSARYFVTYGTAVRAIQASGSASSSSVGRACGALQTRLRPSIPRARRRRRKSACRHGTGAASARSRACARAAASAPNAPGGGCSSASRNASCEGITSAPTASMTCSAWPSITAIVAWMRSTRTRRSRPITSVTSSPRRSESSELAQLPGARHAHALRSCRS